MPPCDTAEDFRRGEGVGGTEGADRQLFEYAFHHGVPIAILTDGREWHFYLPAGEGDYSERRFYLLDIVERDVEECAKRFRRYLDFERFRQGEAFDQAQKDYADQAQRRDVRKRLPEAWRRLVQEEDELLVELLADRVESFCGFQPDKADVVTFLQQLGPPPRKPQPQPNQPQQNARALAPPPDDAKRNSTRRSISTTSFGFTLHGRHHQCRSARDVLVEAFRRLAEDDPGFLQRFADLPRHGRRRRYLSTNRNDLYPGRPDLARDHSAEVAAGWWLGTNQSRESIRKILQTACDVANLKFEHDLKVDLGDG